MDNQHSLTELGSAAAGIAHDINNQLTLILNYIEMSNLEGARLAARRCTALTAGLLSWCRGESVHLAPLRLQDFLLDFADGLELPEGVTLTLDIAAAAPEINADALGLTRVLTNLVLNANQAMEGKGKLTIRAFGQTIEIADTGRGISREDARRIFEPFFSTKGDKGTGLGLAVVREIMRQHGGGVWVRSEPGHGATFCLRFRERVDNLHNT